MPVLVAHKNSGALLRRLKEAQEAVDPRRPKFDRLRTALKKAIIADNIDKLLGQGGSPWAGVDRFGKDLAPPADSTVKGWRLRLGRVLAPEGMKSRTITNFAVKWTFQGGQWRAVAGWKGIPWMLYHLEGRRKGSHPLHPNWQLPRRDVGGISPKGWVELRGIFADFMRNAWR